MFEHAGNQKGLHATREPLPPQSEGGLRVPGAESQGPVELTGGVSTPAMSLCLVQGTVQLGPDRHANWEERGLSTGT